MSGMLAGASSFNQNLCAWNIEATSSLTGVTDMFQSTSCSVTTDPDLNLLGTAGNNWCFSCLAAFCSSECSATGASGDPLSDSEFQAAVDSYVAGTLAGYEQFGTVINCWDVSAVTSMSNAFQDADSFNDNLSCWDTSSVTDMLAMFSGASAFDQEISFWDVSSVTDMNSMFDSATVFNQDISIWDVSSVSDMSFMFQLSSSFTQDISSWDVSSVSSMLGMFNGAAAFTQDLCLWNDQATATLTDVSLIFDGTACAVTTDPDLSLLGSAGNTWCVTC